MTAPTTSDETTREQTTPSVLVLACGALARELLAVVELNSLSNVTVECLPGELHMRPERIVPALEERLAHHEASDSEPYDRILIGYGDCGTSGLLDELCATHRLERLPGDHCFQFFAGGEHYLRMQDDEPGTFYLTDYLAKHFDRFVIAALGIDRHPELAAMYFGNYKRLVYLCQVPDAKVEDKARAAAERLGLDFDMVQTGYGELEPAVVEVALGNKPTETETA